MKNKTLNQLKVTPGHDFEALQTIRERILRINPDHVRIRYYPAYKINTEHEIEIIHLDDKMYKKMKKYIKDTNLDSVTGHFTEYGIKDTFVRISNTDKNLYFRREQHIFRSNTIDGIFIIEFYKICNEDEFPHIVKYHHNISCSATTYNFDNYCICESKFDDKKTIIDINVDIEINLLNEQLDQFFSDIIQLKKELIL